MKVSIWSPVEYALEGLPGGWPAPGKHWTPERGSLSMARALELLDFAVESGFDMVTVAEHHYGYGSLIPSPAIMAAALAQRYDRVGIGILGPILALSNPLRVAEEIAMVDVISGGRVLAGFFRGTPLEHLAYGVAPVQTRDMYLEGLALIIRAWTEPETFGWEGVYHRFRMVSAWPRPLQQPYPPVVLGAASVEAARYAGAKGFILGIFGGVVPHLAATGIAREFRIAAAESDRNVTPDDILYRARVHVADTDEDAERDVIQHGLGDMRALTAPAPERADSAARMMQALGGGHGPQPSAHAFPPMPELWGSPETVLQRIRESAGRIGWGRLDAIFTHPYLPHEKAKRSLELFASEVLPRLHGER